MQPHLLSVAAAHGCGCCHILGLPETPSTVRCCETSPANGFCYAEATLLQHIPLSHDSLLSESEELLDGHDCCPKNTCTSIPLPSLQRTTPAQPCPSNTSHHCSLACGLEGCLRRAPLFDDSHCDSQVRRPGRPLRAARWQEPMGLPTLHPLPRRPGTHRWAPRATHHRQYRPTAHMTCLHVIRNATQRNAAQARALWCAAHAQEHCKRELMQAQCPWEHG